MADSDNSDIDEDLGETESDKQKWFQEEVSGLINRSLKDRAAFICIIGELDHVRLAHSQKPAGLNREVVRTMINLPFSVNSCINGDLDVYAITFKELLEKYDSLLRSLNKNKEAQLEGVEYVTTPYLELIRSEKLSAADWSTNKVGPVISALKNHCIIEEVRVKDFMAVIEQGIKDITHHRNVQLMEVEQQREAERQSLMSLVSDAAAKTAPATEPTPEAMEVECGGCIVPSPDIDSPTLDELEKLPSLTSKRFSGKFDHNGGRLDTYLTNDYLDIPPGAIPEGSLYSIWGSVHSALDNFGEWVDKAKGERLIAPVNEFCVEGNHHFLKRVHLVIHHAIAEKFFSEVKIALKEDDGSYLPVYPKEQRKKGKPWFEINKDIIVIHTLQLCQVLCKVDGKIIEGKLRGLLYGLMFRKRGKYIAKFQFYMHFCRNDVQTLQGQRENFRTFQAHAGYELMGVEEFAPASAVELEPRDKFRVEFVLFEDDANQWALRSDSDNQLVETVTLESKMPLLVKDDDPVLIAKYTLCSANESVDFPLEAKLKIKIERDPPNGDYKMIFDIMAEPCGGQFVGMPLSTSRLELEEGELFAIAKLIDPNGLYDLALTQLKLKHVEVKQIETNNASNCVQQIFLVLRLWHHRLPSRVGAREKLVTALRTCAQSDAADALLSNGNSSVGDAIVGAAGGGQKQ